MRPSMRVSFPTPSYTTRLTQTSMVRHAPGARPNPAPVGSFALRFGTSNPPKKPQAPAQTGTDGKGPQGKKGSINRADFLKMGFLSLFAAAAAATGTLGLANTPEGQELLNGDLARQLKEQGIDIQELLDAIKDIQENKIPAVDTKTTDLAWDIATLNSTLTEHKTKLDDLETRMVAQETASTEIGGRTNALETLTEGFKTTIASIQETMGGLGTKITELTGNFQTFVTETLPQQFEDWRQDIATAWGNGISNLRTELKPLIDTVTVQFNNFINFFATPVKTGIDWIQDRIEDIRSFVKKHLPIDSILNWQLPQWNIQIPSLLPTPSSK